MKYLLTSLVIGAVLTAGCRAPEQAELPPPPDISVERPEVADAENAWPLFIEALRTISWSGDLEKRRLDMVQNDHWDPQLAQEILDLNEQALNLYRQAVKAPESVAPLVGPEEVVMPANGMAFFRDLMRLHIRALFEAGHDPEALDEAAALAHLGRRLSDGRSGVLFYLVGLSVVRTGLESIERMLPRQTLPPGQLQTLAEELAALHDDGTILERALAGECNHFLMAQLDEGARALVYDREETSATAKRYFASLMAVADKPYAAMDLDQKRQDVPKPDSKLRLLFGGNAQGQTMLAIMLPAVTRIPEAKCRTNTHIAALRCLVALRAWSADHDELPNSLAELTPRYIDHVPRDDYDGQPMRYSKEKGIVYSVGQDLTDGGGAAPEVADLDKMADPTWRIRFRPEGVSADTPGQLP